MSVELRQWEPEGPVIIFQIDSDRTQETQVADSVNNS